MVAFILCLAVVNLALGYGVALYLHGHGSAFSRGQLTRLPRWLRFLPYFNGEDEFADTDPATVPTTTATTSAAGAARESEAKIQEPHSTSGGNDSLSAFRSLAAETAIERPTPGGPTDADASAAAIPASAVEPRLGAGSIAAAAAAPATAPPVDEAAIARAIDGLQADLDSYRGEITTLDERLRDCALSPHESTIRQCASGLRQANEQFLEHQTAHRQRLSAAANDGRENARTLEQITEAASRQAAVISETQARLEGLELESDLLAQCENLLKETRLITRSSDDLASTIGAAMAATEAGSSPSGAELAASQRGAERVVFNDRIESWWSSVADAGLCVAMIDPDSIAGLNERHGRQIVDRMLAVLNRKIAGQLKAGQEIVRENGQTQFVLLPQLALFEAVNFAERCRQEIDATRFQYGEGTLRLTVSCAVTETRREEQPAALVARLKAMLNEAKRYGRNRTFFQDDGHPSPATPPPLAIEHDIIPLDALEV